MKRDLMTLGLDLGHELIIDNFAGGGGTSTGLEAAFGRPVDIAINHDPEALAMHAINHPHTKHLCESVWDVDPIKVTNNLPVALVWLSPDCKHFSKAKGGRPVEKNIRGLAWVTMRWAAKCKPRVIMLENVEEFQTWGPLKMVMVDGEPTWFPDPAKKGVTFRSFVRQLEGHGYKVGFRELRASEHNTPTIRKRFFLVARRDGIPIGWPKASHGARDLPAVLAGKMSPFRTAAECIDWSIPCPSIFSRKRPLAENTLRRVAKGIMRYVVEAEKPFVVPHGPILVSPFLNEHANASTQRVMPADEPLRTICAQVKGGQFGLVQAFLAKHYTGVVGSSLGDPIGTITSSDHHSLVTAHLTKFRTGSTGSDLVDPMPTITAGPKENPAGAPHALGLVTSNLVKLRGTSCAASMDEPLHTISAQGQHHAEVRAFLIKYYGADQDPRLEEPLHTITTKHRFGLVTIHGQDYEIVDIGLRMLEPHELYRAQGFPPDYVIAEIPDPKLLFVNGHQVEGDPLKLPRVKLPKSSQVRMCGNSVCPPLSEALIRANFQHEREMAREAA
jgi:DNA (cytosine-5)-methyltransferase 1